MDNQPQDLLAKEDYFVPIEYATTGQRFLNYIIDTIFMYVVAIIIMIPFIDGDEDIATWLFYGVYLTYLFVAEGAFKGKTLGKLITRTRAVNDDGTDISFRTGFYRGLSRIVPFEPFSALGGYPWHDKWTKTRVATEASLSRRNE